jgi:hypothetical protein
LERDIDLLKACQDILLIDLLLKFTFYTNFKFKTLQIIVMPKQKNPLTEYNKELNKVRKEHKRLPDWGAKIVAQDHMKLKKKMRD